MKSLQESSYLSIKHKLKPFIWLALSALVLSGCVEEGPQINTEYFECLTSGFPDALCEFVYGEPIT